MNNNLILVIVALATGAMIPIQATPNAALSKAVGPIITTLIVLLIAIFSISMYILVSRTPLPEISKVKNSPAYGYLFKKYLTNQICLCLPADLYPFVCMLAM